RPERAAVPPGGRPEVAGAGLPPRHCPRSVDARRVPADAARVPAVRLRHAPLAGLRWHAGHRTPAGSLAPTNCPIVPTVPRRPAQSGTYVRFFREDRVDPRPGVANG